MKKRLAVILALMAVLTTMSFTALAADTKAINYYDEYGNQITIGGMYYNSQGYPMYNANCYYLDADGNPTYVGGCRAYYYDSDGNLTAGTYYYNANGKAVSCPASYPDGWGCGMYYYDAQGSVVNGTFYYDDFGNLVDPPVTSTPSYRGCGFGCGRQR